jgi:dCMP deaminase
MPVGVLLNEPRENPIQTRKNLVNDVRKHDIAFLLLVFLILSFMNTRITWDQYFMGLALLSAQRSKDPRTKIGACIVDSHNRIVGIGYNGFPRGCPDDEFPHARGRDENGNLLRLYDSKHAYVVHAEANAILNSMGRDMQGATLYCAMPTCNECAKLIVQV